MASPVRVWTLVKAGTRMPRLRRSAGENRALADATLIEVGLFVFVVAVCASVVASLSKVFTDNTVKLAMTFLFFTIACTVILVLSFSIKKIYDKPNPNLVK